MTKFNIFKNLKLRKKIALLTSLLMLGSVVTLFSGCSSEKKSGSNEKTLTLRVCNWEEYIDEGDWGEDEVIDLDSGDIFGENSLVEDFETWYYETYGVKVKVEYSTFGTNEDLYNTLTLGDVYDLVCPSDYMIMKLMAEGKLQAFSDEFFDTDNEYNYYINGVSDYIQNVFTENQINGESWSQYAAGYMWGTTGIVYNPEYITEEEASSWKLLADEKYSRKITIKDNVRDSMFLGLGILFSDKLTSDEFKADANYSDNIQELMNDTSEKTVEDCEEVLKSIKDVAYSFETDSGKADMVTGKVYANYQWSGDAVYTMDQAEEDDVYLNYSVPEECSNLWFDGWVMLKSGINGDSDRQQAAEAFINFISRPDNAVRNMYYIGYTSTISGGDDDTILEYVDWCYSADEDEEDVVDYDISYFFDDEAVITCSADQLNRQLAAQYPTEEVMERCAVMWYFDSEANSRINQMWINVRCFNVEDAVGPLLILVAVILVITGVSLIYFHRHRVFNIKKK